MGLFSSIKKIANPLSAVNAQTSSLSNKNVMSMIPGIGDSMAAEKQNAANKENAQTQMDYQERLSNSSYQRAMADMKAAGLNPMLAFSQGGASTPSGALPTVNSETKTKLGEFVANSALGVKNAATAQQQANTQQASAQQGIDLSKAQTAKTVADTQRTQVETAIRKKDVPTAELKEQLSTKGTNLVRQVIDSITNSAKSSGSFSDELAKKRYQNSNAHKDKRTKK